MNVSREQEPSTRTVPCFESHFILSRISFSKSTKLNEIEDVFLERECSVFGHKRSCDGCRGRFSCVIVEKTKNDRIEMMCVGLYFSV